MVNILTSKSCEVGVSCMFFCIRIQNTGPSWLMDRSHNSRLFKRSHLCFWEILFCHFGRTDGSKHYNTHEPVAEEKKPVRCE